MPTPTNKPGLTLSQLAECEERVFSAHPQVGRYFPAAAIEDARKRLGRAIERGEGPGLVIGGPGTGKSLLLQVLAAQYHNRYDVVLLACARLCTRRALLQAILFELGLPYKIRDEGELRLSLLDHLLSVDDSPTGLLLLVDEAQNYPIALLDELRVLTNLVRGDRPRVRLVLAGSSSLEESFAHPELQSFSQRLAVRCYLGSIGQEETRQFVRAQLAASGARPDEIVASDAWGAIFDATDGVPRLVNQLCDRALDFGAAHQRTNIDSDLIQRAWSDLQQLPTPWEAPAVVGASMPSPVVEFGGLAPAIATAEFAEDQFGDELTDLDFDDEILTPETCPARPAVEAKTADPFAEEFDEEEVVIDQFASWDELFRRDAPRVENRRDPSFAPLVQTIIDALPNSPVDELRGSVLNVVSNQGIDEGSPVSSASVDSARSEISVNRHRHDVATSPEAEWPPLRLAVVSDPPSLVPVELVPVELVPAGAAGSARNSATGFRMSTIEINQGDRKPPSPVEPPVIVVEDDRGPRSAPPPVRRESYRHLFSRLRSG